jgi:hypothetical protein
MYVYYEYNKMIWKKIKRMIGIKDFKPFIDPRFPDWTQDHKVWEYLRENYQIDHGGWIDDSDKPPILTFRKIEPGGTRANL